MKATKEEIKKWLDTQIGVMNVQAQRLTLTEVPDVLDEDKLVPDLVLHNLSSCYYIHLGSQALRFVAKVMELPVTVTDKFKDEPDVRYELEFTYNGVRFIALESETNYDKNKELA
jgi:hypothetical protein